MASNTIVIGYGLAWDGLQGNLPYLALWARGEDKKKVATALRRGGPKKKARKKSRRN